MHRMTDTTRIPRRRSIVSFVRRTGRLTPSQQRALDTLWPQFGIDLGDVQLDPPALFGRIAALTLEIGFGNGDTLVELAAADPDTDFIGIEVHEPGVGHCLLRARDAGIGNLRLIVHDAIEVLKDHVSPDTLDRINLYFPDPWPKKRHHKRRIVQTSFLELCSRALKRGGTLHIATDWENYAEHIDETIAASAVFRTAERRQHDGDKPLFRPVTKFERRGMRRGHRIWDWHIINEK